MKVKTSVTLSEELLKALATEIGSENRSAFIETAAWEYLRSQHRLARDRKELELINSGADALNEEALDVIAYQEKT